MANLFKHHSSHCHRTINIYIEREEKNERERERERERKRVQLELRDIELVRTISQQASFRPCPSLTEFFEILSLTKTTRQICFLSL